MISVIIPTLNESENLPRLINVLGQQGRADLEIIVADGGSRDDTTRIAQPLVSSTNRSHLLPMIFAMPSSLFLEECVSRMALFVSGQEILPLGGIHH